jgi:acetyl esterase/lipase
VPLELRVAAWLRVASWLQKLGRFPTMAEIPRIPIAKRKAARPPWWMTRPIPVDVQVEDHQADETGLSVAVRVYRPAHATLPLPIVLFLHGGGFVNGGLDAMQFLCAHVASKADATVVSVDYPLAPENPYPAPLDAAYEVACWLAEHGEQLGGNPTEITVMGDSAGANLAAAVCLLARRDAHPRICRQILIYPALDATLSTPGMASSPAARRDECNTFYSYYAGAADRADELISPLLADDLRDLPPCLIITADHDALRDDGRLYATRLRDANVPVRHTNYLGMPHGFLSMPRLCRAAPQALAEIADVLAIRSNRDTDITGSNTHGWAKSGSAGAEPR